MDPGWHNQQQPFSGDCDEVYVFHSACDENRHYFQTLGPFAETGGGQRTSIGIIAVQNSPNPAGESCRVTQNARDLESCPRAVDSRSGRALRPPARTSEIAVSRFGRIPAGDATPLGLPSLSEGH